ncbi:MAG: methylenetetrahydrofolate--tRNA-(uracil(54)-C(5))-methyltransferase (FADH(2)-oxidizing) TrmFO [Acidobacteria bacterium]|nr:methylenetetrahydrofolate--tRNA-(uracil(54)-C(5))-methyltransferase (FADH(2)-oxidizing) TrmFO [Acidobacteriota bacterium]
MAPMARVTVIGGGFAGVECAHQLLRRGHAVTLVEMRPVRTTDAHATDRLAEMVCSNSFRSDNPANAVGLLKREMESVGSLVLEEARKAAVPAGDALAVDRTIFADAVTRRLAAEPLLTIVRAEAEALPDPGDGFVVVATGPLTSPALEKALLALLGEKYLYFYDAMAPIVEAASLDMEKLYALSRYGKGGGDDYLNVPLSRAEYESFVAALLAGEKVPFHDFEKAVYFEGCLPAEAMAERGVETLRHGPMKPFGLPDPRTGREPYAVVQLRQDDLAKTHFNLVGFQTKLKVGEQRRVFRMLPGLENAEFVRYGMLHRNTYINGPAHLDGFFRWRKDPRVFFAGQLTGVEGYLESAATGLMVGATLAQLLEGREPAPLAFSTALGSLARHVSTPREGDFTPMNVTFGLIDDAGVPPSKDRAKRRAEIARRALEEVARWRAEALPVPSVTARGAGAA